MLDLPGESSDPATSLQDLLDAWTAPREMSDSVCASCSQLTSSQQVTFISKAPATLVVIINRTRWIDGAGGFGDKNNRPVQFGRTASLLVRSASGTTRTQRYDVRGIGVHIGPSLNAGHYKAFVAVRNDTWVCADDADTTEVSWSDVSKVSPTIMVLERQQHGGGAAATHGTHVPAFWSAAVAAAGGQASGSEGQASGGVSGETDRDSRGDTDGDGSGSGSGSGSKSSKSRKSNRSRSRSRSSSGGSSSGGSGSSSDEAADLRRRKGKIPDNIEGGLGHSAQSVERAPPTKKQRRADKPIEEAMQKLAGPREKVQEFLRLSTEASPQQLQLCRALLKDGGAGLLSATHASNGCQIYSGKATSVSDLGPATIRNILAAASQTRGPVGDMAAVLDGPESTERTRAEEGLRRLGVAAEAGDVVAFLGVCGEIGVQIHIDPTHPAFAYSAGRTEPLLVGWGACPKYDELPFYDPVCPLLTGKLWRAAVQASPFGGDAGGAIAALNKNNSCSRSVHDRGGNCFDSKTMPPRVRELSRTFLDLTCTLLLNCFPDARALMVISFGEVRDAGAARHGVVWSGKGNKVGTFAAHHICTVPSGLAAATSNFAGLCLLHHAARDREGCRTLEDLGGERRRSAVADAVDALVGAQDFVQPHKTAAAFDGEKEALRAGVKENDEVFEEAFNAIRTRLGPALFTTQQSSDGGEASINKRKEDPEKFRQDCADGGEASIKKRKEDPEKFRQDCADGGAAKYTAEERGAEKSTVELKAEGATAKLGTTYSSTEKKQRGIRGKELKIDIEPYRTPLGRHHRAFVDPSTNKPVVSKGTSAFFLWTIPGFNDGKPVVGRHAFDTNGGKKTSSYPADSKGVEIEQTRTAGYRRFQHQELVRMAKAAAKQAQEAADKAST